MKVALLGLDPLFDTNVKLSIKRIHELKSVENLSLDLFHLYDHVIRIVDICGIIVGVERTFTQVIYTVDDSSSTICCPVWDENPTVIKNPLKLGTSVRVFGKITTFNSERQIDVSDIFELKDPNEEIVHSLQILAFDSKYKKPYKLPKYIENNKEKLVNALKPKPSTNSNQSNDEDIFTEAVYGFLLENTKNIAFMSSFPRRDQKLVEKAKEIILKKHIDAPSETEILPLFEKAIKNLCKKGLVKSSKNKPGMFEVVEPNELKKFILRIISDIQQQADSRRSGVKIDYIRILVIEEFKSLSFADLDAIIDDMFVRGLITISEDDEYRIYI